MHAVEGEAADPANVSTRQGGATEAIQGEDSATLQGEEEVAEEATQATLREAS